MMQLQHFITRRDQIEKQLEDDPTLYQELGKEYAFLTKICNLIKQIEDCKQTIAECKEIAEEDPSMKDELLAEIKALSEQEKQLEAEIKALLLSRQSCEDSNAVIELRPGAGGVESCLFIQDLMRMYVGFAKIKQWQVEEKEILPNDQGGLRYVCLLIKGDDVFKWMQAESGVHRVQRVPATEAQGRIHTSTVTVAVLPEEKLIEVKIEQKDLEIDVYRSGGKGGQSVNTTDSAVRITHKPSGIVVAMQDERSQLMNKQKAMQILKMKLYQKQQEEEEQSRAKDRKDQVGSGDRCEKIRTYNFPQDRCTDHRVGKSWHNLPLILTGQGLGSIVEAVRVLLQQQQLESLQEAN